MTRTFAALSAIAVALTANAQTTPPTCPALPSVTAYQSLASLPSEVRAAITAQVKDIVDRNQPFDATDVVVHGAHFNRFAFAWHGNGRWIVGTERGGFVYSNPVYTVIWPLTTPASGGPLAAYAARIVKTTLSRPADLCTTAQHALQEPLPPMPPVKPQSVTHG